VAPKPSAASSSTSKLDETSDEMIVDETQVLLYQGITGHAIIGYRQAPPKD
jgi:hypothetical protein